MKLVKIKMLALPIMLLTMLLTACAPAVDKPVSTGNYEVYLDAAVQSSTGTLVSNANSYRYKKDRLLTTPVETTISVTLNGETQTLHYLESRITLQNDETYEFISEDKNLSFLYFAPNMQLRKITLNNQNMSAFENMTQAEYEAWIRQFVEQYTTENWEEYQVNYRTQYTASDGTHHKEQEFLDTLPAGSTLTDRVFNHVKYYDTLSTVDILTVRFSFEDNFVAVIFNPEWFDTYNVSIDIEKMQTAITDYVKANLWENTTLQDITFSNGTLLRADGNYLCKWTVATYILTDRGEVVADSYDVLVDVPDA